ncbi:hypothetical protein [Myxococcus sp. Y35]|uniref:hypothetical protein n=1 Tax=Pseudomyxococcus flavus TaxID=3115648 RepID=UPI003CF2C279
MEDRLRRIQSVTRYYDWLQGLRFLPFGLVLLGFALWLAWLPAGGGSAAAVGALSLGVGVLAALVLHPVLGIYYQRRFGQVRPSAATKRPRLQMALAFSGVGLLLALGLAALASRGSDSHLSVSGALAVSAAALVAYWAVIGRFIPHYPPIAGAMFLVAALHQLGLNPVCGWMHAGEATSTGPCGLVTFNAAWGLALVVLTLLDHRMLVHTLSPAPAEAVE